MPNWKESMQQTYEFYIVDPGTWRDGEKLNLVKTCTIERDSEVETLGSASFDITDLVGECYVRVYLITIQNGIKEKHPLGTFLIQTPSSSFDGKSRSVTVDAYTPLIELKEKQPPVGYYIPKDDNVMDCAYRLIRENARCPVVKTNGNISNPSDFISDTEDTWLSFISAFVTGHAYALETSYQLDLDEMGRIIFSPKVEVDSMSPVWTYDDDNSSILYPELTMDHDMFGIPNVVEVVYSTKGISYHKTAINDDPNSPTSTVNRGRRIIYREVNPDLTGNPTENQIEDYANQLLKELSTLKCTVTYTHGYCPVRVGDCVRLNYARSGLTDIKAKIIRQSIKCEPGCPVTETAIFTTKLWR